MLNHHLHRWAASLPALLCLLCMTAAAGLLAPAAPLHAQAAPAAGPAAGPTPSPYPAPQVTPPPAFDPLPARPADPLPGGDYPAGAALPAAASPLAPGSGGRPAGVDLDVLYIERTPRYERYAVVYGEGAPTLSPGSEGARRWPAPGEVVTFTAHVMNKGTQPITGFGAAWYIDGVEVKRDTGAGTLWPETEAEFTLQWAWDHRLEGERLLDAHSVRFVADPDQQIAETFETNNDLEDRTDALALEVVIAPQAYGALNYYPQAGQTFSAEDWVQRHVRAFNAALGASVHPAAPQGAAVRVRVDTIRIAWDQPRVDLGYDGGWFINADYRTTSSYYHPDEDLDWGMLHEWGHQLGLIDTYRYRVDAAAVDVQRHDGSPLGEGYDFPGDGLMETLGSIELDELNAAGLNTTQGYRRGYYGEFQFDLAPTIVLALRTSAGCAVPDAAVAFYQRDAAPGSALGGPDVNRHIDNQPEFVGTTGADGRLPLPNRSSGGPPGGLTTATGHMLRDNPFGALEVVGSGNIGLLKVQKDGREQFAWLTVPDLNLDYWRQGRPAVQEITLVWEGDGIECPPHETPTATPPVTPAPTPTPTRTAAPTPRAPVELAVEVTGQGQEGGTGGSPGGAAVTLSWQEAGAADGFYVEWAQGAADWALLAEVQPGAATVTVEELACGMSYRFRVAAYNSAGVSPYSVELVYTTPPCAVLLKKTYLPAVFR